MLWQYALKLESGGAFKRLGFAAENVLRLPDIYLAKIQAKCKKGILLLDPSGPKAGPVNRRWGIRVNIPLIDIS